MNQTAAAAFFLPAARVLILWTDLWTGGDGQEKRKDGKKFKELSAWILIIIPQLMMSALESDKTSGS